MIFQEIIQNISTTEQPAHLIQKKKTFEFELILNKNYYTNMKSIHVCFPIRFIKLANATAKLAADLIPVNNLFAHWVKEIDILNMVQIKGSYQQQYLRKSIDILNPC